MAKIINTNKVKEKYIYFVQQGLNGNIKIGYSSDLDSRIKALQTASPEKLRLLHKIPVESQEEETRIHNMFKDKQKTGEWFEYCSEIISFIEQDKLEREEKKWNLVAQHIQEQESKIRQLEESLLESNNNYDFGFSIHSITDIYLSVEEPRVISGITCFGETFGKGRPAYMKDHCYVELDNIESLGLMAYLREENPEDSFDLYEWVSFQRSEKLESASERRKALAKSLEDLRQTYSKELVNIFLKSEKINRNIYVESSLWEIKSCIHGETFCRDISDTPYDLYQLEALIKPKEFLFHDFYLKLSGPTFFWEGKANAKNNGISTVDIEVHVEGYSLTEKYSYSEIEKIIDDSYGNQEVDSN